MKDEGSRVPRGELRSQRSYIKPDHAPWQSNAMPPAYASNERGQHGRWRVVFVVLMVMLAAALFLAGVIRSQGQRSDEPDTPVSTVQM